jgi:hypothetical protein
MLISSSDFVNVSETPKGVWAKLKRGPVEDQSPVSRWVERVRYDEARSRFSDWAAKRLGPVRDLKALFNLVWPEANECYEMAVKETLAGGQGVLGSHFRSGDCVAVPDLLMPAQGGLVTLVGVEFKTQPDADEAALRTIFTRSVLEKNGVSVGECRLFYLNPDYIEGKSRPEDLFKEANIMEELAKREGETEGRFEQLEDLIHRADPPTRRDEYCPRVDDATLPSEHVFLLKNGRKRAAKALSAGFSALKDIPLDETVTPSHRIQIESARSGRTHVDKEKLAEFLKRLPYPRQSLDFETISAPVPIHANSRPHQSLPVQFSLYTKEAPGQQVLQRAHFLHREPTDPRSALLKALRANLRPEGSILVYSAACEANVIKELGRDFPEFEGFAEQIMPRLVDLYEVFRGCLLYDPRQRGKTRFKKVLECFADKSYDDLAIRNGEDATSQYQRVTYELLGPVKKEDRDAVYRSLEVYCDQDSWGQHALVDVIERLVDRNPQDVSEVSGVGLTISRQAFRAENVAALTTTTTERGI